jgi:hypothetical protein
MQFSIAYSTTVISASTDVLDVDEITSADISRLLDDTKVFNSIGMSIALSIALCEGREICDPTVNEDEIGQLLETLDKRIEGVVIRQENSEEELTDIITAYIDTKERYHDYMNKLSKISKSPVVEDEFSNEDIFADEDAMTEDEFSAFDDADELLEDDVDLEDDEYDPEEL